MMRRWLQVGCGGVMATQRWQQGECAVPSLVWVWRLWTTEDVGEKQLEIGVEGSGISWRGDDKVA